MGHCTSPTGTTGTSATPTRRTAASGISRGARQGASGAYRPQVRRADVERNSFRSATPLGKLASAELVKLLTHPNAWYSREARRILMERRDSAVRAPLAEMV